MAMNEESLTLLQRTLSAESATWTAGRNSLFVLTDEELKLRLGVTIPPGALSVEEREKQSVLNLQQHAAPRGDVLTAIDWRNIGGRDFVGFPKDQGSCGSCVAFSVAATLDARIRLIRNLANNDPNSILLTDLSEAQLFYCGNASNSACSLGWYPDDAFAFCESNGLAPEYSYPYTSGNQPCGVSPNWTYLVTKLKKTGKYFDVNQMKGWLSSQGPLTCLFTVYSDFYYYAAGIYRRSSGSVQEGSHSLSVIGFNDLLQAWLCKNSWGTQWGEDGFCWIGYGQCGIDAEMWAPDSFDTIFPQEGTVCLIESTMVGLVMEGPGGDTNPGAIVNSAPALNPLISFQLWVFTSDGHIVNLESGLVLSIAGGSTQPGAAVELATQVVPSVWYQVWTMSADGHIGIAGMDLVLDITGGSWDPGTPIQTWTRNFPNSINQTWKLSYIFGLPASAPATAPKP